jgi:predicted Zn-dependent protease
MKRKQMLAGLTVAVAALAAGCAPRVTPIGPGYVFRPEKDELRLWEQADKESAALQASGKLNRDPELERYVQSVLVRLIGQNRQAYLPLKLRVFILDDPSINAFALPNGDIIVHTGILARMRNEAQLATLLGHELTHNTRRHMYCWREKAYGSSGAYSYIAVLSSVGGGNIQNLASGVSGLIARAAIYGYSRENEQEADRVGLTLAAQAGYDPHQGAEMFRAALAATDPRDRRFNFFYSTHPKMEQRVEDCDALIKQMPSELLAGATDLGQDRYLTAAIELIHGEVERQIAQGKYALADETLTFLAQARPEDADTFAHRGDLYRARAAAGDRDQARAAYERALELDPDQARAHRGLGLLCAQEGEKESAVENLRKYTEEAKDAPDVPYIQKYITQLSD